MVNTEKRKILKGFSLVEVMTSLVIMVILITIASGVIITTFNIFARNTLYRVAQDNGNNVYNYIYDHVSYATSLKIAGNVDININGNSNTPDKIDFIDENNREEIEKSGLYRIDPYFEQIVINKANTDGQAMVLNRKDIKCNKNGSIVMQDFYIFGNEEKTNTMNGCTCKVRFEPYPVKDAFGNITDYPDTVQFSVTISRDGEDLYSHSGSIPLLNESVKKHIDIPNNGVDNSADRLEIFYTYLQ